jgi:GAF domain-containing protein
MTKIDDINYQHHIEIEHVIDQLEKLNDIGIALSTEHDASQLLEKILLSAISLTNADGGTIYTIENNRIKFNVIHSKSLGIHLNSNRDAVILPSVPLFNRDEPNFKNVVSYSYHKNETVNIQDAYHAEGFDFSGTRMFDALNHYRSTSFLTVPLKNNDDETIGMLQLINALDSKTQAVIPFNALAQRFCESLASQAAVVLTKQKLLSNLEQLFAFMTVLIIDAILL